MNCLKIVFLSAGFASHEDMDALYNRQVRRFYGSLGYQLRFARRIWEHRWSLGTSSGIQPGCCGPPAISAPTGPAGR